MPKRTLGPGWLVPGLLLTMAALPVTGCSKPDDREFRYDIDAQVAPVEESRVGPGGSSRPLAGVADADGTVTSFVANEILVRIGPDELDDFLDRVDGTVVGSDALPPMIGEQQVPAELQEATEYIVEVDSAQQSLDDFSDDVVEALGVDAKATFSDDRGARLMALIARLTVEGYDVAPSIALTPSATYLVQALEHPDGAGGNQDALLYFPFFWDDDGSNSAVSAAWAYLAQREVTNRVRVAIIDGGFRLDPVSGMPLDTATDGTSDYAVAAGWSRPIQWDTLDDDTTAGGTNPASCTGGSPCPWHGHQSAMTATAVLGNGFGMAGTGGQVADPILIKTDITTGSVKEGLRAARTFGADVVSMSFGGECDNVFCQFYYSLERYADAFWDAKQAGMLLVNSAGNNDRDARNKIPCRYNPSVFCIGSINRDDTDKAGFSNFGSNVDLFAPSGIPVYTPDNTGTLGIGAFSGTSASTPYVAGVAAMLKAADPSLGPDELQDILVRTGREDSSDSLVPRYLDAIDAIREVYGRSYPPDANEPNPSSSPTLVELTGPGRFEVNDVSLHDDSDVDYYLLRAATWMGVTIVLPRTSYITEIDPILVKRGSSSGLVRASNEVFTNLRRTVYRGLAPGDYLLTVRHDQRQSVDRRREALYDLFVDVTLESSPAADGFESNNTLATAFDFGAVRGTRRATHHTSVDVDHYRFDVGSLFGTETMDFVVRSTDFPVDLELYADGATTPTVTSNTGALRLGTGTWTVRVVQPDGETNRYTFSTLGAVPPTEEQENLFAPRPDSFWRLIVELGSIDWSVIRGAEYFLIPQGPPRPDEFWVEGDVVVDLFLADGQLVGPAELVDNGQGLLVNRLSTQGASTDQDWVVRVMPAGFDAEVVDEDFFADASFPETPFRMYWPDP